MQRSKRIWAVLVAVLLMTVSTVTWAAGNLYAGYQVVRVMVNGREVQSPVPAIIFNGSTLIPLRAAVEAMGGQVAWDAATNTATITAQTATTGGDSAALKTENQSLKTQLATVQSELATTKTELAEAQRSLKEANGVLNPPISEKGRGRSNPMPTGQTLTAALTQNQGKLEFSARFTITEATRGDQAWKKILATNQFNNPAGPGFEYVLTKMKVELVSISDPEASVEFSDFWFTAVSASGRDYERVSVVDPDPAFGTRLYRGASAEGYMVFAVEKTDPAPLLTFARDSQGKNGYWMELKTLTAATPALPTGGPAVPGPVTPRPGTTSPAPDLATIKTPEALVTYLNTHYGSVSTPTGTVSLTYDILTNDRTYFGFDMWIQMEFEPSLYFLDLDTKVGISGADKQASIDQLRQQARSVYAAAAAAFPGKKIKGEYYDSWYKYPSLQVGYETRRYLSWQNYEDNLLGPSDTYANATLTDFHFEPKWDDTKF